MFESLAVRLAVRLNVSVLSRIVFGASLASLLFTTSGVQAAIVDWSGNYRFEYFQQDNLTLGEPNGSKIYALNRLSLSPRIVAIDGVNIVSQFEILSNQQYLSSQLGMPMGQGTTTATDTSTSNVTSKNQGTSAIQVRHLYLKINQEYGSIVAGRAPIHFGLGMTYNAGYGLFDHWGDVHDLFGYRFLIDNVSIMPMIGKPYQSSFASGKTATDVMWNIEYNNQDSRSMVGVFYQTRTASLDANDGQNVINSNVSSVYTNTKPMGAWGTQLVSLYFARGWDGFNFKMEGGFNGGSTGISRTDTPDGNPRDIRMNGYGLAIEMDFPKPESKLLWSIKTGMASGDNPTTENFEGFMFHRNYNVGMLMFNQPMGSYDLFRTGFQRSRAPCTATPPASCAFYANNVAADEETVSNAFYFAPSLDYKMNDRWSWKNTLIWAQLSTNPLPTVGVSSNDVAKDVGFELDTSFIYQPHERVQWINELGLFQPGAAWKGGSMDYKNQFTYGFSSKAAISF